jgi:ureidoacrylate peracid hydrolase
MLRTLEEQAHPHHTALLIIDPQKDFCADDGAMAARGVDLSATQEAVPRINRLVEAARRAGATVVWVRAVLSDARMLPNQKLLYGEGDRIRVVREGSDGAEWYSAVIRPLADEAIITKWNYDAFADTELDLLLRSQGIRTLLLTGFATNVCVETTARHGFVKGYYIVLVSDCTAANTAQEHEMALFNIQSYFGRVATSGEIISIWGSS